MAKSGRKLAADPSLSSFHFAIDDHRIRKLQLAAENPDYDATTAAAADQIEERENDSAAISDPMATLLTRSTVHFSRGHHNDALIDADAAIEIEETPVALFCRARALAGLRKYGPAEAAFRKAQSKIRPDDTLNILIERELRHLRFNVLQSMELKENGEKWGNPVEAFRIAREEDNLNAAMKRYTSLTEPKVKSWNWTEDQKKLKNMAQSFAHLNTSNSMNGNNFVSKPVPTPQKQVAPPPGFSSSSITVSSPVSQSPGPIQRPTPVARIIETPKTVAQLLSSNKSEWQTTGLKPLKKKSLTSDADLPTNVFGCEGIWIGGINVKCTQNEILEIFKRFGTIHASNMGQSKDAKYMFISYDAVLPPARAVKEMNACFNKKITVNQDTPLIVRFEPSQTQRPIFQTWSVEKTREKAHLKGECFLWRTKEGCFDHPCKYAHHERNRGVDSASWLNKQIRK